MGFLSFASLIKLILLMISDMSFLVISDSLFNFLFFCKQQLVNGVTVANAEGY